MLNKKIGILGGGQLGKMLCEAAIPLHLDIHILDKSKDYPAGICCTNFTEGDFSKFEDVVDFGSNMDVVSIEIESVNSEALRELKRRGVKVIPDPEALELIKDKGLQKQFYEINGFPSSSFRLFDNKASILASINAGELSIPFVQKARKDGYDGRGVMIVNKAEDLPELLDCPCLVEEKVKIKKELAVIVARNQSGEIKAYPSVEMVFDPKANLVQRLICPAQVTEGLEAKAEKLAIDLIESFGLEGLLAVELFLDKNDTLLINEVAPRPHNSGHHTIEANFTSQFEQHLRTLLNLPLGNTELIVPGVMINVLGEPGFEGPAKYLGLPSVMKSKGANLHIYGKKITKPYRKMGHITIINSSLEEAIRTSEQIQKDFKVIA
jgi:5-(carboxyamino)imidazole ribonucleotide synthase